MFREACINFRYAFVWSALHRQPQSQAYLSVQGRAGIFFDAQNVEVERSFQFRMCHMSLLEAKRTWSNETFVLWRLPCKPVPNKCDLNIGVTEGATQCEDDNIPVITRGHYTPYLLSAHTNMRVVV